MRFRSWRSETWKRFFRRSSPHLISRCLLVPNCLRADLPNDVQQIRMTEIGHGLSTGGHFVQKCQVTSSKSKKKTTFRYKKYHAFPLIPKQRYLGHSCPIRDPSYLWVSLYGRNILHIPPRCSALNDPLVDHASITCERFLYLFCESVAIFARGGLWTVAWVCWGSSSLMEDFSVIFSFF